MLDCLDESIEHIVEIAADLLEVPFALVRLPDHDRTWSTSHLEGTSPNPSKLAATFSSCALGSQKLEIVEDAQQDARFSGEPVVSDAGIHFCAGVAIHSSDGSRIGTLCVMDVQYREAGEGMRRYIDYLGKIVAHEIALPRERAANEKTEEELERVQSEYEAVFENANDAIFLVDVTRTSGDEAGDDLEFRFLRMNTGQEDVTGFETERFLGRTPTDVLGEEAGRVVEANYRRCVEAKDVIEYEEEIPFPSGATYWQTKLSPMIVDGEVKRLVGIARDMSERREDRRQREEARPELEEQRDILHRTEEVAQVGGWEYDAISDTVRGTRGLYRVLAWSGPKEFDLERGLEFCPPEVRLKVRDAAEECLARGTPFDLEVPITRADGERRFVHLRGQPKTKNETVTGITGVVQDVTQRKESEERLRVLSSALDQSGEAVVITKACPPDAVAPPIVYANSAFEKMTGYQEESILGRTPALLRGEETSDSMFESMAEAMRRGETWSGEMTTYRKDGTPYIAQWNIAPVRSDAGTIHNWVSTHRDVTERRELEEKLLRIGDEERQRIGQYLHDTLASHLAGAGMVARTLADQLAEQGSPLCDKAKTVGNVIGESGEQVRQLSHTLMPALGPSEELSTVLELLADRREKMADVQCWLETRGDIPFLAEDVALHLYRIAEEAVSNAFKHGDPDQIEIELAAVEQRLDLFVRDDGVGLPDETEPEDGFGLRLMQYRADLIGANLEIRTEEGGGTVVHCRLDTETME